MGLGHPVSHRQCAHGVCVRLCMRECVCMRESVCMKRECAYERECVSCTHSGRIAKICVVRDCICACMYHTGNWRNENVCVCVCVYVCVCITQAVGA